MGYGNRIISNTVVKAPSSDPFTAAEFRSWSNNPFTEDDTMIEGIITAARQFVEAKCNISIGKQTRKVSCVLDSTLSFHLPSMPMIDIDEVLYSNCDCPGSYEEQTVDVGYSLIGETFPVFRGFSGGWYEITYIAGYNPVPDGILNVVKAVALSMYEQRGDASWSLPSWIKEQLKIYSRKTWV